MNGSALRLAICASALLCGCDKEGRKPVDTNEIATRATDSFGTVTCEIRGGQVWCKGGNGWGQLGRTGPASNEFVWVSGTTNARSVAVGLAHVCLLNTSGEVHCWGSSLFGQLGTKPPPPAKNIAANDPSLLTITPKRINGLADIVEIAAGDYFTCSRARSGRVHCWGKTGLEGDRTGQLMSVRLPAQPMQLFAGADHACVVSTANEVLCWGRVVDSGGTPKFLGRPKQVFRLSSRGELQQWPHGVCRLSQKGPRHCWGRPLRVSTSRQ